MSDERRDERARIVKYLREVAKWDASLGDTAERRIDGAAEAIERGVHMQPVGWRYVELCPGVINIEGDIIGKRVRVRGPQREPGFVEKEGDGCVYLQLDGIGLYVCNRTNFTIEE